MLVPVRWVAAFLDWTDEQLCRKCGASLGGARVMLEERAIGEWRASLACGVCAEENAARIYGDGSEPRRMQLA